MGRVHGMECPRQSQCTPTQGRIPSARATAAATTAVLHKSRPETLGTAPHLLPHALQLIRRCCRVWRCSRATAGLAHGDKELV